MKRKIVEVTLLKTKTGNDYARLDFANVYTETSVEQVESVAMFDTLANLKKIKPGMDFICS